MVPVIVMEPVPAARAGLAYPAIQKLAVLPAPPLLAILLVIMEPVYAKRAILGPTVKAATAREPAFKELATLPLEPVCVMLATLGPFVTARHFLFV